MSKKLSLYSLIFLAILTVAVAVPSVDVIEDNLQISLSPDRETIIPLTIVNTGTESLTLNFDISALDLTDRDGDAIAISFEPSQPTVQPNENITVNIHTTPERTISFETFGGPLRVHDVASTNVQDIVNLALEVQPDVCDFGAVGLDLDVDIQEPGNGDDFKPGEEISIEVKVQNNGQNSIRVQTEAFLFSKSRNIQDTASETKTIDEDDDFTFTMSMIVPSDPEELDADEDLQLVVKAFDDENERRNCAIDSLDVDIELEDQAVAIDARESRIFPEIAACGDTVKGYVMVRNVGAEENDRVTISITNKEMGISQRSDTFLLESFEDSNRNTATRQFEIKIPATAKEKSYPFTARVEFEGGSEEIVMPFQVASCQAGRRDDALIGSVMIRPLEEQVSLNQGAVAAVPVQITNFLNERVIYTVMIINIGEIGQSGTKTITVNPGQITTAFLDLIIKSDAEPGLYSGSIVVKQGSKTVGAQTLLVEVKEGLAQPSRAAGSTIQNIPLTVWVILVIMAIGAVILAVMASLKYLKLKPQGRP